MENDCISSHWRSGVLGLSSVCWVEYSCFFICSDDGLEVMAVEMEGMFSAVWKLLVSDVVSSVSSTDQGCSRRSRRFGLFQEQMGVRIRRRPTGWLHQHLWSWRCKV